MISSNSTGVTDTVTTSRRFQCPDASARPVGGEFEIDPSWLQPLEFTGMPLADVSCFATGRIALRAVLAEIASTTSRRKIMLPDYVCASVAQAVRASGFEPHCYPVDEHLTIDVSRLIVACRARAEIAAVLFVDYFGLSDCAQWIQAFKAEVSDILVIRDNVPALFDMQAPGGEDFRFTSLRKWLPTPDGAVSERADRTRLTASGHEAPFVGMKLLGNIERHIARKLHETEDAQAYLHLSFGEDMLDTSDMSFERMSRTSAAILSHIDISLVAQRRQENFRVLASELSCLGVEPLLPLGENRVPHFLPLLLPSRDRARAVLRDHGIFCPVHWPSLNECDAPGCARLRDGELSIVIDQRYGPEDMRRIAHVLSDCV